MPKVIVRFLKGNGVYVAGDVTQIEDWQAAELLKKEMIVLIECGVMPVNDTTNVAATIPPIPETSQLTCPICGKEFKTEKALKAHKLKAHKIK